MVKVKLKDDMGKSGATRRCMEVATGGVTYRFEIKSFFPTNKNLLYSLISHDIVSLSCQRSR